MNLPAERKRPDAEIEVTSDCFPNITQRGRSRRIRQGIFVTLATAALLAELARRDAGPMAFLLVAPVAGLAALLFFQAKEKT